MKANTDHKSILTFWACIALLILVGMWFPTTSAKAALTPQAMSGTVEVFVAGEQAWKPLTAAMQLNAGDQIRTSPGSAVELWFDDGSLVRLEDATLLVITELEISLAKKTRIARFSLQNGTVSAKITKLGFTESLCEIETDTALVDMKFAEVDVKVLEGGGHTLVTALQGELELVKTREGEVTVYGMLDAQEGMLFPLNKIGGKMSLGVQRIVRKITLAGEGPLQAQTLIGDSDNTVKIDNAAMAPLEINYFGSNVVLEQDRAATFGIPFLEELSMTAAGNVNCALWFKDRATQYDGLYVFADKGPITANGKTIETGAFELFASDQAQTRTLAAPAEETPDARALTQQQEQPVAPPAPESGSPEGAIEPTPSPTVTPTPTPTEPPEELEETTPAPAPTSTPTPTPTSSPTPTPTPMPELQPPSPGGGGGGGGPPPPPQTPTPGSPVNPNP